MSALDKLKSLMPMEASLDTPLVPLLANLKKVLENSPNSHDSLEHLRLSAFDDDDDDLKMDEIDQLVMKFTTYHSEIDEYNKKLLPIHTILSDFHAEISELSSSLIALQQKLNNLSTNAADQTKTTDSFNRVILDLMISPDIVKSVVNDEINVEWVENIKFINEKLQLIESIKSSKDSPYKLYKAFEQLQVGIKDLIAKAVERIRDFLIDQIKLLRGSIKQSSQSIQQLLVLVKDIFAFLQTHHQELACQLRLAYIYSMKWYYQTRFAKYLYALQKLSIRHIDLSLVLGYTNEGYGLFNKSWFGSSLQLSAIPAPASQNYQVTMQDYLQSIDKRIEILDSKKAQLSIPSQIAESTPFAYWLEFIYNQWAVALIDNVIVEYLFMVEFFYGGQEKFDKVDDGKEWWQIMFAPVFKMGQEFGQWLITHNPSLISKNNNSTAARLSLSFGSGTYDAFAMLLIIRLVQNSQSVLHNEIHIPIMDEYLNSILLMFWPHFTKIIDANCESMRKVMMHTAKDGLAPLNITQQFAHFMAGLLKSSKTSKDYKGEPLYTSITRLRNDFESLLTKFSNHMFGGKKQTEKEVFLYNNYFLVVSILKNETEGYKNDLVEEQVAHFTVLADAFSKHKK